MYGFEDLRITEHFSTNSGLMVKAVFPDWKYNFNFLVLHDGSIIGKNSRGIWEKLSSFAAGIVRAKLYYLVTIKNQVY